MLSWPGHGSGEVAAGGGFLGAWHGLRTPARRVEGGGSLGATRGAASRQEVALGRRPRAVGGAAAEPAEELA